MVSRRGLFKGLFGLGAAKVLAPIAKITPEAKLEADGQANCATEVVEIPVFRPMVYFASVKYRKCDIALRDKLIPQVTEGEHYVG